jgi:phosphatidylserine/phosphatidylglycerophosphate/cardiolipin synthase-like enzyme
VVRTSARIAAVAAGLLLLSACQANLTGANGGSGSSGPASKGSKHVKPSATAQAGSATYTVYTDPQAGYAWIYHLIDGARHSIDLTMYELSDSTAEADLGKAAAAGVDVRVILDGGYEKSANTAAYDYLRAHHVHVAWSPSRYTITHQKTLTIDDHTTAIMTGNLTSRYYSTTRDFTVVEDDPADVKAVVATFDADYRAQAVSPGGGDHLVWSPTDSQSRLVSLISSASKRLSVENEEMDDSAITSALAAAAKRGVTVEVTMTNDDNDYARAFDTLAAAGVHVHTYAYTATLYIHAKVVIADGDRMFLGSENFSPTSLTDNRELGLITTASGVIAPVAAALTSDYAGAKAWTDQG